MTRLTARLKQAARRLKRDAVTVYFLARDPQTPWPLRILALIIAAYALSPVDLIPDFIPVLGFLDDVLLLPLVIWLVLRLSPPDVIKASRSRADAALEKPVSRVAMVVVVLIWLVVALWLTDWLVAQMGH
ncbi:MAG: DUF1232 domain-containing protein [Marinobacter sp.]|nr:DUF1232 domain-containing protein [Marinobacter sp.]